MIGAIIVLGITGLLYGTIRLGARRPPLEAAVALLCVAAPLEVYRTDVAVANLSPFRVGLAVLLLTLALSGPRASATALVRVARSRAVGAFALLVLLMVGSTLLGSQNHHLALKIVSQAVIGLVGALLVATALRRGVRERSLLVALCAGAVIPLVAAVYQALAIRWHGSAPLPLLDQLPLSRDLESSRAGASFAGGVVRLRGTFGDPNHFGVYLVIVGAAGCQLLRDALRGRRTTTVVTLAAYLVAVACIGLGTSSRSSWLAAVIGALAVVALRPRQVATVVRAAWRGAPTVLRAVAGVVVVGAIVAAAVGPIGGRLTAGDANAVSDSVHLETMTAAFDDVRGAPAFGIGLGDFGLEQGQGALSSGAHSSYLTIGAELGLVGLALFLAAVGSVLLRLRPTASTGSAAMFGAYVGFLLACLVYDLWLDDFHWVVVGLALGSAATVAPPADAPEAATATDDLPAEAVPT